MANATTRFAEKLTSFGVDLLRFEESEAQAVRRLLFALLDDLSDQLRRAAVGEASLTATNLRRVEALVRQIDDTLRVYYRTAAARHRGKLFDLADLTQRQTIRLGEEVFKFSAFSTTISPGDLRTLVGNTLIRGAPSADWWARQSANLRNRFATELRLGVLQGESNDQLIRRIRGTATGGRVRVELPNGKFRTVNTFSGGIMQTTTREAEALVRSSVQAVSNQTVLDLYRENGDVIKGVEAIVTLDDKTSLICIGYDGAAWSLEGPPLPDSTATENFPGPPPYHWQCRTILAPITYTWEELIERTTGKRMRVLESFADSQRASLDGQVSSKFTYADLLRKKGPAFQDQVLGPGRARLFREGKITTAQLIDQRGRPLTVAELIAKYDK